MALRRRFARLLAGAAARIGDPIPAPAGAAPRPDYARSLLQTKFVETIGWTVDRFDLDDTGLTIRGWALHPTARPDDLRFLVNDVPFARVDSPLPSADVAAVFDAMPHAGQCRFVCRHDAAAELFRDGYARVACVPPYGDHQETYRKAQFLLDPALEGPVPEAHRIARVIDGGEASYRIGGATLAKRFDIYLAQRFGRPLAGFASVLDWGCGAGRLTRHLVRLCGGAVAGVDIDPDNIAWCAGALPQASFLAGPLRPPLPYADGAFDLVIGTSVFTHLDEATQHLWLAELRRIVRPGGLVLASIHGLAQMVFYGVTAEHLARIARDGIAVLSQNTQINAVIEDQTYYKNVFHSPDYIFRTWAEYFEVVDIAESLATNQDLVAMRRRY